MKRIFIILCLPLFFLLLKTNVFATGVGLYFNGGGGFGFLDIDRSSFKAVDSSGLYLFGGGLVVDTNLAKDDLFNYRLNLGYDYIRFNFNNSSGVTDAKFHRINIFNNFGFGVVRNKLLRFWLGPQLGLRFQFGDVTWKNHPLATSYVIKLTESMLGPSAAIRYHFWKDHEQNKNVFMSGLSLGLAMGLNLNLTELITLSFEAGARYGMAARIFVVTTQGGESSGTSFEHELMHGFEAYGIVAIIFRFNDDNYQIKSSQ